MSYDTKLTRTIALAVLVASVLAVAATAVHAECPELRGSLDIKGIRYVNGEETRIKCRNGTYVSRPGLIQVLGMPGGDPDCMVLRGDYDQLNRYFATSCAAWDPLCFENDGTHVMTMQQEITRRGAPKRKCLVMGAGLCELAENCPWDEALGASLHGIKTFDSAGEAKSEKGSLTYFLTDLTGNTIRFVGTYKVRPR